MSSVVPTRVWSLDTHLRDAVFHLLNAERSLEAAHDLARGPARNELERMSAVTRKLRAHTATVRRHTQTRESAR